MLTFITFLLITSSLTKVYAKNSFDRFGDDVYEEILQYLTFEDKIRLECVSKQWKRCVYQRQYVIEVFDLDISNTHNSLNRLSKLKVYKRKLNVKAFQSVLKKCPNIKTVFIGINVESKVLSMIGRYCHCIKSLKYRKINPSMIASFRTKKFFRMYGHKLEELSVTEN